MSTRLTKNCDVALVHGTGALRGGEVTVDASSSSQFVSALLLSGARFEAAADPVEQRIGPQALGVHRHDIGGHHTMPAPRGEDANQASPGPQIQNNIAGSEGKMPSEENTSEFGSQVFGGHADQAVFVQEEMHASAIRHGTLPEA